jgi:hypothetical protein
VAVLGKYVPQLEFFEILLGDRPVLDAPVRYYQRLLAHDEDEASDMIEEYLRDHPWQSVFDDVLMPALALARRDRDRGELEPGDAEVVYQTTRELLDDLVFREQQISKIASTPVDETPPPEGPTVTALGFPAHDEADELALRMLGLMLEPLSCRLEIFSSRSLAAEVCDRACQKQPAFVVLAGLAPGSLASVRHLCKRLRSQCPETKLIVVRWGVDENPERTRDSLRHAGADGVTATLHEARAFAAPLIQLAAANRGTAPTREPQPAHAAG